MFLKYFIANLAAIPLYFATVFGALMGALNVKDKFEYYTEGTIYILLVSFIMTLIPNSLAYFVSKRNAENKEKNRKYFIFFTIVITVLLSAITFFYGLSTY
ncbi:hypothetical protein H1215_13645 [Anoxybacillus sp. LAT_38]|uniref:hypothetical protein n=1 Tax=Anoxybacillus sp. LAT_26 TaxID=2862719 RepID=UPI001EEA972F|nr:hypothetical protein [Anoxybacillus sp. LAT_26]MCG6184024.1 hypothetical protein [Anoxybacillus sp. LAT_26]MCG6185334.1 hypothetical protein [Anoxybacillus sp. LAT_26]MCG6198213.1 hypothetical protein [Anoxybacillus sp. LAT_38]